MITLNVTIANDADASSTDYAFDVTRNASGTIVVSNDVDRATLNAFLAELRDVIDADV